MKKIVLTSTALFGLIGASTAFAQTATKDTNYDINLLTGSDTMVDVMNYAIDVAADGVVGGAQLPLSYNGIGSSAGQRQLEGGATNTGEPTCASTDPDNIGCQDIAPMSRQMNSAVCNDPEAVGNAEGLAICGDALVIISDNTSYQATENEAGKACTTVSSTPGLEGGAAAKAELGGAKTLANGYQIGANGIEPWQDVLRLVYTGCTNTDAFGATSCAVAGNRKTRCDGQARKDLVATWTNLFEVGSDGTVCNSGTCPSGLRAAYRRDDSSGTTNVFLDFLDVVNSSAALGSRSEYYNLLGNATVAAPNDQAFCDGGDVEACFASVVSADSSTPTKQQLITADFGDPIRTNCIAGDELCCGDGKMGLVRAVRSVVDSMPTTQAYPTKWCTTGVWRLRAINSSTLRVCPSATLAGQPNTNLGKTGASCWMPANTEGGPDNFNCINRSTNLPAGYTGDGRAWNYLINNVASSPAIKTIDATRVRLPDVAQWRQNMSANPPIVGAQNVTPVCQERSGTRNIGCLTGNTTCTIGFSGEEAGKLAPYSNLNEGYVIDSSTGGLGTPSATDLQRKLYINAIGGFEAVGGAQCAALTNESATYCQAQKDLTNWFLNPANAAAACTAANYTALPTPVCVPGAGGTGTAADGYLGVVTCGGTNTSPTLAECTPM
jgi:hypothetical protein